MQKPEEKASAKGAVDLANSGRCDGCYQVRANTTLYGHVDAPPGSWVRLCKQCQAPGGQPRAEATNRFVELSKKRRKLWKGMSRKERSLMSSRMVIDHWPDPNRERPPKPGAEAKAGEEAEHETME